MQKIRVRNVLGYTTLPGILPRLKDLFGSGFGQIAFLTAYIFQAARLLPPTHPYLNPVNVGKFSIRQVIAQAANNLIWDRRHLDQIIIFVALISGFVLLILQFLYLIFTLGIQPAHAAFTMPFTGMFSTALPNDDIAFQLMDKIFGVPGFFGSAFDAAAPLPFQQAMQGLFAFYSYALLVIAVVIFLYYVFVLIAETAQSGTPFGRRFNHLWAPLRLVVALGLLVPISWGYNTGQYIVLSAAKMGSGFATNGWLLFNTSLQNPLGTTSNDSLFARPKVPDAWPLVKFMMLAGTCREAYERVGVTDIKPYLVKSGVAADEVIPGYTYRNAVTYFNDRDVVITFGKWYTDDSPFGGITPYCGSVTVFTHTPVDPSHPAYAGSETLIGPWAVQEGYFSMIKFLWAYPGGTTMSNAFAEVMSALYLSGDPATTCDNTIVSPYNPEIDCVTGVTPDFMRTVRNNRQSLFEVQVASAYTQMVAASVGNMGLTPQMQALGWAGAGVWYNHIAEMNGIFSAATTFLPSPNELPIPLKELVDEKRKKNMDVSSKNIFTMHLAGGKEVQFLDVNTKMVARTLSQAYEKLGADELMMETETLKKQNVFEDTLNYFMGLNGLFSLRENVDIHPLAQLVALGKGIVDGAVRSLFTATVFSFGGGLATALPDGLRGIGGFLDAASSIFVTIATLGLSVGFVLYYVIPFLPFIYFYFAVGAWVKTIFEAMVGVPLWALAHMRIDGNGLPGDSAMSGYYMILEIFLRPILTVFGLIGSLIIFAAMVRTLHDIFPLVTSNLAGFDNNPCDAATGGCNFTGNTVVNPTNPVVAQLLEFKRSVVDEFMFTIIYTIIVYMMATASFKLIDQVPQQILRWMGAGVQVFADNMPDAAEGLKGYIATSGYLMTSKLINQGMATSRELGRAGGIGINELLGSKTNASISGTPKKPSQTP